MVLDWQLVTGEKPQRINLIICFLLLPDVSPSSARRRGFAEGLPHGVSWTVLVALRQVHRNGAANGKYMQLLQTHTGCLGLEKPTKANA